jgi:VanZ family protein
LLSIVILTLCFMRIEPLPVAPMTDFDKLAHLLMFLGLSGTIFFDNTLHFRRRISLRRILFGSFLLPLLAGGLIEIMQEHLTRYRSGDWRDFLFDSLGAILGAAIAVLINRRLRRR